MADRDTWRENKMSGERESANGTQKSLKKEAIESKGHMEGER